MVTLKQIAARTGVSINTVSRVLSGSNKEVWASVAKRAERIRRVAGEMGYRVHLAARVTRTGRYGSIGLVVGTGAHGRFPVGQVLAGIQRAAQAEGLHLLLAGLPDEATRVRDGAPRLLREVACDGLIVTDDAQVPVSVVRLIGRQHVPSVWVNVKRPRNAVYPDEAGMARAATGRLLGLGHRRIAYANLGCGPKDPAGHFSATDRARGYAEALRAAGLAPRVLPAAHRLEYEQYVPSCRDWLRRRDRPTAVVAYTPHTAGAFLLAAAMEGLRVPGDLSLVTFAPGPWRQSGVNVATVLLPEEEMGARAVAMLRRRIAAGGGSERSQEVAGGWYDGDTLAPPAATPSCG